MIDKIQPSHLARHAIVYLRQSDPRQVREHPESTARQYALERRAVELGWPAERVEIIDEDLGQSGASTERRHGFQRLAEDVARGRVGAIFALEVSRLARSSSDWYRLLDLCRLADVVLIDEQTVYSPRTSDDRLLLGLKGAMSEAEQTWMRLRLDGGKLNKARRGALRLTPAVGYVWDEEQGGFRFDPDEHVQRAVRLIFKRFRLDGSAFAVVRYFVRHGLEMPARDTAIPELRWAAPRYSLVDRVLRNPLYAGAYTYGRYEQRTALVDGQVRRRCHAKQAPDEWAVCLRDHHPAYISWEEFMANQHKLRNNTPLRHADQSGAARKGHALLQGLALCGKCGRKMHVCYCGRFARARYDCHAPLKYGGEHRYCWLVLARTIDEAVARLFLATVQAPEIELGLAVVREAERQAAEVDQQWKLRLERARYEARLAERRYKAVDPDHRVVARTLEHEWNEKLRELDTLEQAHRDARQAHKLELSDADRARILALAKDLPRVWNAATTTHAERKNLLRMLVQQVTLTPIDIPERGTRIQVLWRTGAVSDFAIPRPEPGARTTSEEALEGIRTWLGPSRTNEQIAAALNERGLRNHRNKPWNAEAIRRLRKRHGLLPPGRSPSRVPQPLRRGDGLYSQHASRSRRAASARGSTRVGSRLLGAAATASRSGSSSTPRQ
jgi:DNA invertase Pin-like site-specific DNA recombinase